MNILLTANDRYLCAVKTVIYSLRQCTERKLDVFLLYDYMEKQNLEDLKQYVNHKCEATLFAYQIKENFFSSLKMQDHFTPIIYYRLISQKILPERVSRILYLDVDIIINGNIDDFYDTDFGNNVVVACENRGDTLVHKKRLGLDMTSCYVNAGVLLLNMKKIRETVPAENVIQCIDKNRNILEWYDQDVLNILYEGKILLCDNINYNFQTSAAIYNHRELRNILKKVKIIHFSGTLKPWMKGYTGSLGKIYYNLLWHGGMKKLALRLGVYNTLKRWLSFLHGRT